MQFVINLTYHCKKIYPSEFHESDYLSLPKIFEIYSKDIDHGSGQKKIRQHLIRSKKESIVGQEVQKLELDLCKEDISSARTTADIDNWYEKQKSARDPLRNFYYSSKRDKRKRTYELQKQKYVDQLCSKECKYVSSSGNTVPALFVGDRGYGIGSRLKGHSRQGGTWKPKNHGLYTFVCITNEHNTSQTCPFYFGKLFHPAKTSYNKSGKKKTKLVNSFFVCYNQECVSVLESKNTHGRNSLSAFAIGLSELAMLMFGATFPTFTPNISHFKTEFFNQKAVAFLDRNAKRPTVDDV